MDGQGKYWYECQNGELVPKGCFAENGDRVELNGRYVSNGYEIQCTQNAAGYLEFRFTGCSDGERVYHVGDTWENKERMYYFECRQDGPYVKVEVAGCVSHDKSRRIPLGQQYDFGNYTYECQRKYNGSIQLCSVGCIHNGEHIKVGEQFPDGDFLFYCKSTGGVCQKVCVGCQIRNKRLYNGDRIRRDNSVFQCLVRREKYGIKPVACVDDDGVERVVGCRWNKQAESSKVEQTCEVRFKRAVVKTLGCIFVHKGYDILFLYPNTWTIWTESVGGKSIGVACRNTGDEFEGKFSVDTFDVDNVAEKTVGLHFDQPRGK
ncbi:Protein F42A8.1 [Aphelenchoides avenae]|nr:Protein F42A8.1 [Aphelenchus avenae]